MKKHFKEIDIETHLHGSSVLIKVKSFYGEDEPFSIEAWDSDDALIPEHNDLWPQILHIAEYELFKANGGYCYA